MPTGILALRPSAGVVQSGVIDRGDEITGVRALVRESFRDQTCIDLGKYFSGSLTPVEIFIVTLQ